MPDSDSALCPPIDVQQSKKEILESPVVDSQFNVDPVSFLVENTIFRVDRHRLNLPGSAFESMFSLPQCPSQSVEGTSNDNPIHLKGISAEHFRFFLRLMYPQRGQPPPSFDEWLGILTLSTLWEFTEIRCEAIACLTPMMEARSALESIYYGRKYDVVEWTREAYIFLARRENFDLNELLEDPQFPLDLQTASKILLIRDMHFVQNLRMSLGFHNACHRNHQLSLCPWGYSLDPIYTMDESKAKEYVESVFSL